VIPRFFVPGADTTGSTIALPDDEAAHLLRVLRLRAGDTVRIFDGRGREWQGTVERTTRAHAAVRLVESLTPAPEAGVRVVLAVAVLKGDKTDEVIRDAVMLGVTAVRPLVTERTEVKESVLTRGRRRDRWQQIAIASAKQCGRAVVPAIEPPLSLEQALASPPAGMRVALAEPGAAGRTHALKDVDRPDAAEIFVGPEGGWSEREVAALAATSLLLTLGLHTLRADAAPIVALTALRVAWGDL
jgi:16S rRNA (uracil1498-N3)-methyltransferase